jgi:hypothetical protein
LARSKHLSLAKAVSIRLRTGLNGGRNKSPESRKGGRPSRC